MLADLAANADACTVNCIGTELGINWMLFMTAGCMVSMVGINYLLSFDNVTGTPDVDNLDINVFKNAYDMNNKGV